MRVTYVDAAALGFPALLGLLGIWLGFGRALVSWPIRWLVSLFGAGIAALLAALYLIVNAKLADLVYLSGAIARTAIAAVAFLATLAMLLMFMGNLRERVMVWTGHRRIGAMARVFGACLGIACGLALVAIPYALYEAVRADQDNDHPWVRESVSLSYFRSAGDAVKNALGPYLPAPSGQPQQSR